MTELDVVAQNAEFRVEFVKGVAGEVEGGFRLVVKRLGFGKAE